MLRHLFVQVGFLNAVRMSGLISLLCCGFSTLTITSARPPSPAPFKLEDYKSCLKEGRYLSLLVGSAIISLGADPPHTCHPATDFTTGLYVPPFYIAEFVRAQDDGAGSSEDHLSIYILAIMNVGGFVGRILPAVLSDRVGRFNILFLSALLSGVSCICLWLPTSSVLTLGGRIALEVTFAFSFGFFSGGFIALINVCIAEISNNQKVGSSVGLLYCLISFPSVHISRPLRGNPHPII
jgi:MFS family permease